MGPRRSSFVCFILFCALALCCAAPALALEPAGDGWYWQSPQPQGKLLNDVTFSDALNVWAVGDGGTVMHSPDAGATWSRVGVPSLEVLDAVVFADALHGWAAGGTDKDVDQEDSTDAHSGVILVTDDGGATWSVQRELTASGIADIAFLDVRNGWAVGTGGLLLRTVDGGRTWAEQPSGTTRNLLAVAFSDARHGCIGAAGGVVLYTSNGGETWRRGRAAISGVEGDVATLLARPDGTVWAGLGGRTVSGRFPRLARSTDGGRTWRIVPGPGIGYDIWGLAADGDRLLAVGPYAPPGPSQDTNPVSRVLVRGARGAWSPSIIGASAQLAAVASNGAGLLCAVGDGIVTSADRGRTWLGRSTHVLGVADIDMVSGSEGWMCGGISLLGGAAYEDPETAEGKLFHTADGVRWDERLRGEGVLLAVDFADAANGWVTGAGGLVKHTADGGRTWSDQQSGVECSLFYASAISPSVAWAAGIESSQFDLMSILIRTGDAGQTWSRVTIPRGFFGFTMDFPSATEGCMAGVVVTGGSLDPALLSTKDGGGTWDSLSLSDLLPGTTYPMALDFADSRHGWLACLDDATGLPSLLATSDGGDTWQMVAGSGAFGGEYISAIEFVGPLEGWAAGESLFHTTDGGTTWTRQVSGVTRQLTTIAAVDAAHVWAGGAGLISTVDAAGDVATPVTLSDVRGGWTRRAAAIHLTAADVGDSRPVSTEYRVDDGPWTTGLIPPRFSAPSDHSGDGMHTVEYRSTDAAGNVEPVQSVAVNIDTVRPVVRLGRCTIGSDGVLRLRMRVGDVSCPSVDWLAFKVTSLQGETFVTASYEGMRVTTNRWLTFEDEGWRYLRAGRYRISLRVRDRAGNTSVRRAKGILVVAPRRGGVGCAAGDADAPPVVRRVVAPPSSQETASAWRRARGAVGVLSRRLEIGD
jgi:photosystem II stability/assembly factor-like uncharacterized protein